MLGEMPVANPHLTRFVAKRKCIHCELILIVFVVMLDHNTLYLDIYETFMANVQDLPLGQRASPFHLGSVRTMSVKDLITMHDLDWAFVLEMADEAMYNL